MALVQKKNTRQTTLLLIVLLVVVIGSLVTYVFLKSPTGTDSGAAGFGPRDPEIFTNFGENLYTTDQFRRLHDFSSEAPTTTTTPTPIQAPTSNVNGSPSVPVVDLPPNTQVGNPNPFSS